MHTQPEESKFLVDNHATWGRTQLPSTNTPKANGSFSKTDIAHRGWPNTAHKKVWIANRRDRNNRNVYDDNIQTAAQKHRKEAMEHLPRDLSAHPAAESVYNIR